jgi:hypothetical protein
MVTPSVPRQHPLAYPALRQLAKGERPGLPALGAQPPGFVSRKRRRLRRSGGGGSLLRQRDIAVGSA